MKYIEFTLKTLTKLFWYLKNNPTKLTPTNIKRYFIGYYRLFNLKDLPTEQLEQFLFRLTKLHPECLEKKMCPCTCDFPGKALSDEACERNCYPEFMDKDSWESYKFIYEIDMDKVEEQGLEIFTNNFSEDY